MPEATGPEAAAEALAITTWIAHDGVRVLQIDSSPEIEEDSDGPHIRIYLNDALLHGPKRTHTEADPLEQPAGEKAIFVSDAQQ
jgi:hypothetical protein